MKKYLIIFILSALGLSARGAISRDSLKNAASRWRDYIEHQQYDSVIAQASRLYAISSSRDDETARLYAGVHLAQAYSASSSYDSAYYYLDKVSYGIEQSELDSLKFIYYNVKAIMSVYVEMDHALALESFIKALELVQDGDTGFDDGSRERLILCNIANLYDMRGDILGLEYAMQAYEKSKEAGDYYVLPSAIITLAQMKTLEGDYSAALGYIAELENLADVIGEPQCRYMAYLLFGNTYAALGEQKEAAAYYEKALSMDDSVKDKSAIISSYLNYGDCLKEMGQYGKALALYEKGLSLATESNRLESLDGLYLGLSEVYELLGNKEKSYAYSRQYNIMQQQQMANERKFSHLVLRNERLQREKEQQESELRLAEANQRRTLVSALLAILALICIVIYILYTRKNRMYRLLAEKYYEAAKTAQQGAPARPAVPDGQYAELFRKVQEMMTGEHFYRRQDVSLDMLAEALGSNRSYVSKAINAGSGMTFYNYINSFRIAEAEEELRDPDNDIPLKALCDDLGFNSLSVFYRCFQKKTGIPPSRYRQEMRLLNASDQASGLPSASIQAE